MSTQLFDITALDKELRQYCDAQHHALEKLQSENAKLLGEVVHLKALLVTPAIELGRIEVTKEQAICEIQINRLESKSLERELTLEETKRLEILIKSLYMVKEKNAATVADDFRKLSNDQTADNLAKIATASEDE